MPPSEIEQFLRGDLRNAWLTHGPIEVYVRRAGRALQLDSASIFAGDRIVHTLDIANISIRDERKRGRGLFATFLGEIESLVRDPALRGDLAGIYVENVLTARFAVHLEEMGFTRTDRGSHHPCYFIDWATLLSVLVADPNAGPRQRQLG